MYLLHAEGGLRPRICVPTTRRATDVRGDHAGGESFANEGVSKIRLTGGEPLLHRDLDHLVAMLANVDGISDIALTTDGSALAAKAQALKDAGLNRVTVSLDALDDDTFTAMNDVGFPVARVLAGIDAAASAGLTPVKVNMVIKRGVNDHAITPMAAHFRASGHILRFIEYMDVGATQRLADGRGHASSGDHLQDRGALAARADRAELSRRGRDALPLQRRSG